jgi:transcriptional regulator with PAS, ATPase and Fis domain
MDDFTSIKKAMTEYWETFFDRISAMSEARKRYMEDRILPDPDIISEGVVASWERSFAFGVDPDNIRHEFLSNAELKTTMLKNRELINSATPILSSFAKQFSTNQFTVDLYDNTPCLIKCYGKSSELKQRNEYMRPGLIRTEQSCGTTSMSQAILNKQLTQIIGGEHFSGALQDFVCTAAPIMFQNECIGLINVVEHQWKMDRRTMGTIASLAKSVEYNYEQQIIRKKLMLSSSLNEGIIRSIPDGIIVINNLGEITKINNAALELLGLKKQQIENANICALFGKDNPFSAVLKLRAQIRDQEISLNVLGEIKRFIGDIEPIVVEGATVNLLILMKSMKSIKNIFKQVGGWNAMYTFDNIIGNNPIFRQAIMLAEQTASFDSNTLIEGESGTGKELFAHAIHNASAFASGPFVAINCSAIPVGLLESELFGYESGAYTGAKKSGQPGKFEMAEGGTIFLDEINSMPLDIQVKLLRVLQDKRVNRIGGASNILLHIKIIAASNVNLWELAQKGLFRLDLFYRLNVITIHIPPLCQHADDIPLISEGIIKRLANNLDIQLAIADDAMRLLLDYSWPGNVRELENIIERGFVNASLHNSTVITARDIGNLPEFSGLNPNHSRFAHSGFCTFSNVNGDADTNEKTMIQKCLNRNRGNISATAKQLGMARNTLYQRIRKYGL